MFGWKRRARIEYSPGEIKDIAFRALPMLETDLGEPIYLTSDGVVTQAHLTTELGHKLETHEEVVTPDLLGLDLGVSHDTIRDLLGSMNLSQIFRDHNVIFPRPVVSRLTRNIETIVATEPQKMSQLGGELGITAKALEWLVSRDADLVLVDDIVGSSSDIARRRAKLASTVEASTYPVNLNEIEPDDAMLRLLLRDLVLPGSVDPTTNIYTPRQYVEELQNKSRLVLEKNGYIKEKDVQGVRDMAKFARKNDARVLQGWIVTEKYIASELANVKTTLKEEGWFDIRDLTLTCVKPLLGEVVDVEKYGAGYSRFLVRPSYEVSQRNVSTSRMKEQARIDVETLKIDTGSTVDKLASRLKPRAPTFDVKSADLAREMATKFGSAIRSAYISEVRSILESKVEAAHHQIDGKIAAYLRGLTECPEDLKNQLFNEWQQYAVEQGRPTPSRIDEALAMYSEDQEVTMRLVQNAQARLQATSKKDAALVLHLAVVVYHAHHLTSSGILKIAGKMVPKILKAYPEAFPASFYELRKQISAPSPDLVTQVKEDAQD